MDTNNLHETAFQSSEKIIILYLVKRLSKVQGAPMIMRLTQYRDSFSKFLAWATNTDDQGDTSPHGIGKKLHSNQVGAILNGA